MKTPEPYQILPILVFLFFSTLSCQANEPAGPGNAQSAGLSLPSGFEATVVAENLGYGRHLAIRDNGDIYMALRQLNDGHGAVALRDEDSDGKADMVKYFGELAGTGLQIYNGYLYFGNDEQVVRYKLKPGELLPDEKHEVIASGFPEQNQHATKSFAINPDGDLFVNVGGPSNACMEVTRMKGSPGEDPCQQLERHAGIWLFDANKTNQLQEEDGLHYATGIRNAVAIEWNDKASHLYVVQHGRDQLYQFFPGMYTVEEGAALPAEEFFLVEKGDDFGWPYCYYDQFLNKKVLAPEYGGDGKKAGRCSGKKDPIMAFPGHYAPNDLVFYHADQFPEKYHEGAFIAFHGSWNRAPEEQEGYNVVFVPFEGAYPSGDWEVFADGFAGVETIKSPGDAEYRPTGVALGPDGSLYVSDSRDGKIWKISYKK